MKLLFAFLVLLCSIPARAKTQKTEVILYPGNAVAHPQLDEAGS
jgi:hypothetical protein